MSAPCYFVPGEFSNVTSIPFIQKIVEDAGIGYVFDSPGETPVDARKIERGPDGAHGIMLAFHPPAAFGGSVDSPTGFYPERQTWHSPTKSSKAFIGINDAEGVLPMDVIRNKTIHGHSVKLNDGRAWMAPLARMHYGGTHLPCVMLPNEDGEVEYRVKEEYREVSEAADRVRKAFFPSFDVNNQAEAAEDKDPEEVTISTDLSPEEAMSFAIKALGVNYRLGVREVRILELFTQESLREYILALIDWPTFISIFKEVSAAKKKQRASTSRDSAGSGK